MLELLCQIRYRRLFFVLISVPSVCWFWYNIYEHDVANAVNGVVTLDVAGYFCSLVLIVLLTFLILGIMNLFFDLDFEWLQIWIAPKVYLIQMAADLVKK